MDKFVPVNSVSGTKNEWYKVFAHQYMNIENPGLYAWLIENNGIYIGRYTNKTRPLRAYNRNVLKLEAGKPYRNGGSYRRIHHALQRAKIEQKGVHLYFFQNTSNHEKIAQEDYWISRFGTINATSSARIISHSEKNDHFFLERLKEEFLLAVKVSYEPM